MTLIRSVKFGRLKQLMKRLGCTAHKIGEDGIAFTADAAHVDFIHVVRPFRDNEWVPPFVLADLLGHLESKGLVTVDGFERLLETYSR